MHALCVCREIRVRRTFGLVFRAFFARAVCVPDVLLAALRRNEPSGRVFGVFMGGSGVAVQKMLCVEGMVKSVIGKVRFGGWCGLGVREWSRFPSHLYKRKLGGGDGSVISRVRRLWTSLAMRNLPPA